MNIIRAGKVSDPHNTATCTCDVLGGEVDHISVLIHIEEGGGGGGGCCSHEAAVGEFIFIHITALSMHAHFHIHSTERHTAF